MDPATIRVSNPDVQHWIDLLADKAAAKAAMLVAQGEAKAAEYEGRDASAHWAVVAEKGIAGEEGEIMADLQAVAEAYVAAHPEQFTSFEQYVTPDNHAMLVSLCALMAQNGRYEEEAKLKMFELARFERQHIGQAMQVVVRPRG